MNINEGEYMYKPQDSVDLAHHNIMLGMFPNKELICMNLICII